MPDSDILAQAREAFQDAAAAEADNRRDALDDLKSLASARVAPGAPPA